MILHPEYPSILITSCWSGSLCFWDLNQQCLIKRYAFVVSFSI